MKRCKTFIAEENGVRIEITVKQFRKVPAYGKGEIETKCEYIYDKVYALLLESFFQSQIRVKK